MSADNYLYVRPDGDKVVVTMEFASCPPAPVSQRTAVAFDDVDAACKYAYQEELDGYYEYGVRVAPELLERSPEEEANTVKVNKDWLNLALEALEERCKELAASDQDNYSTFYIQGIIDALREEAIRGTATVAVSQMPA